MNGNTELLNFIYQNSEMGVTTIKQLLDISTNQEFNQLLRSQLKEYIEINKQTRALLNQNGCDEKGLSKLEKMRTYMTISLQTLTDRSPSHIAEMMIIGSNMGILDATKNLKHYTDADKDIKSLMNRLLKFEENNVQQLKEFL